MRCDMLAIGVVAAARELNVKVRSSSAWKAPTSSSAGKFLKDSGLNFTVADDMKEAAEKVVAQLDPIEAKRILHVDLS